ncbi:MarC family protein [Gallaecimonas sp. GXIMD1310]|uniref:MarC family protein n=1 Tax=Gallaecimonas sp. GXIMD1310 TaxID=3131926 RepID=UPI00324C2E6A
MAHFITVFMAFFAIMNPLANSSLFIALTGDFSRSEQRSIALRSVLMALLIVALFTFGGRAIFQVFGITLPAFKLAGGVMIGLIGYHLLQGEHSSVHRPADKDLAASRDAALSVAITPLGIPVLAGPGTIATAMNFAAGSTLPEAALVLLAFAVVAVLTYIAFVGGRWVSDFLGANVIKVISRLMGLILAVVGAQMLIDGIKSAFAIG